MENNDVYNSPSAELDIEGEDLEGIALRPLSVTIIGGLFIVLAIIDLVFTAKNGFVTVTSHFWEDGTHSGSGFRFNILWLILYGVGAGLLRRGKFARFVACLIGVLALIIPGLVFIYLFYVSSAKKYFGVKQCFSCRGEKWKNEGFKFRYQICKKCGYQVEVKRA